MRERRSSLKSSKGLARLTIAGIVAATVALATGSAVSAAGWAIVSSPNQSKSNNGLSGVACTSSTNCFAVGAFNSSGTAQTLVERWNGTAWSIVPSPNGSGGSGLNAVACTNATNCVAVGEVGTTVYQTLVEAWNGTSWSIVPSPDGSAGNNQLLGVACTSSTSCTAVGSYEGSTTFQTLIESWNGTSWSIVASPNASGLPNTLNAVACSSSTSCMAVGYYDNGSTFPSLTEHWNGTAWTIVSSPNRGTGQNTFTGVACASSTSCTAVGTNLSGVNATQTLVEHWNGAAWTIVASPNPSTLANGFNGMACINSASCVAVGIFSNTSGVAQTLVESWNGTAWTVVASPSQGAGSNYLNGAACISSTSCVVAGFYQNSPTSAFQTLAETWNGTVWSITPIPNTGGSDNSLSAVSCTSSTNCVAVGTYTNAGVQQTLAESWNGSGWVIVASPNSGSSNNGLSGVSCTSSTSCVAVGTYNKAGVAQTLVESWNGSSWTIVTSANQSTTVNNVLNGIRCTSSTSCVAVGYYFDGSSSSNQTLVESWNGTAWSITTSANQPSSSNDLTAVSCISASACTAVGVSVNGSSIAQTLIEQWNGTAWSISSSPNPGVITNELNGVKCTSSTNCMAVGDYFDASNVDQTLVERWNGSTWTVVASPNQGTGQNYLSGIGCPSTTSCAAVGFSLNASSVPQTLVETWNGSTWSITASPNQGVSSNTLAAVACMSSTSCTAVGAYTSSGASQTLVETGPASSVTSSITVTAPTTGASWARGSSHAITWSSTGSPGANVKIQLFKSGVVVKTIATSVPTSAGTFTWKVPTTLSPATNYQIKITSTTNSKVFGISGKFSIT